ATFELRSERSGRIEVLKSERDEVVKPGDVIAIIDDSAASEADRKAASSAAEKAPAATEARTEPLLSPAARNIAAEKHGKVDQAKGPGKAGRITKEDALPRTAPPAPATTTAAVPSTSAQVAAPIKYHLDVERGERREPATRIRRQIAQNLVAAQHTAAI